MTLKIEKSVNDYREYRYVKLSNGLKVLLIHDTKTISAASLSVGTGSFDESSVLGLAHFLEHMLFMGSRKYPEENEYHNFITKHGGYSNAYTTGDHTCYYFSIQPKYLKDGLDIFAQFFIDPLLTKDSIKREMNAVNSEHTKNILKDNWRYRMMVAECCNKKNPYSRFSTGNLETLDIDNIYDKVKEFYETKYSSLNMNLVVSGNEELDVLETLITDIFTPIPQKPVTINRKYVKPLIPQTMIEMVPINNEDRLIIIWQILTNNINYKSDPLSFIGNLLGNEGVNTLLDNLRKNDLATEISSGVSDKIGDYTLFELNVKLTNKGCMMKKSVYDIIYKYIQLLQNSSTIKDLYNENKCISKINFDQYEVSDILDYVQSLSSKWNTTNIDVNELLSFEMVYPNYDQNIYNLYKKMLSYFTQENSVVLISSQSYKNIKLLTEKWYGIKYMKHANYDNITDNTKAVNKINLQMPTKNPYITLNQTILENIYETSDIHKIIDNSGILVYWKFDDKYNTSNVSIIVSITMSNILSNILTYCKYILYSACIKDILSPYNYECLTANYKITKLLKRDTVILNIYGDRTKINDVLKLNVDYFLMPAISEKIFDMTKTNIKSLLLNDKLSSPYQLVHTILKKEMELLFYDSNDMLQVIDKISYNDMYNFPEEMLKNTSVNCLIQGNIYMVDAKNIAEQLNRLVYVNTNFKYNDDVINNNSVRKIIQSENTKENNSAVIMVFDIEYIKPGVTRNWEHLLCIIELFSMIVDKYFFDELRTKQQLGYIVRTFKKIIGSISNQYYTYCFLIQSSDRNCKYMEDRIDQFLKKYKNTLYDISDDNFETYKKSYYELLIKPDQTLSQSAENNFASIISSNNIFDMKQKLATHIPNITKADIIDFYNKYILGMTAKRRVYGVESSNKKID